MEDGSGEDNASQMGAYGYGTSIVVGGLGLIAQAAVYNKLVENHPEALLVPIATNLIYELNEIRGYYNRTRERMGGGRDYVDDVD